MSSWFKVNYLGLALGMAQKSYASVEKDLKLKVRKCWKLIPSFVKVTGEELVGSLFASYPIQDRVNSEIHIHLHNMKIQKYEFKFSLT